MATTTTNFGLKKYEGTDLFNPLTYENPNSDDVDAAMYYNKQHVCADATELTTGTVHALTKSDTVSPLFSFTATSVYHYGDTFTLNGAPVTALLTSGEVLPEGAYVIGSRVIGYISGGGSLINFYVMKSTDLTPINNIIGNTDISAIGDGTLTGAVSTINGAQIKTAQVSGSISATFADSGAIGGYRSTQGERVPISSLTGFPTGRTIVGYSLYCKNSSAEYYAGVLINHNAALILNCSDPTHTYDIYGTVYYI